MATTTAPADKPALLTGLFRDRDSAERAVAVVTSRGYEPADISVVVDDDFRKRIFPVSGGDGSELDKAAQGVDLGGPAGGTLATLFTAAAAVGTFLLAPGLFIAGPVAAALAGAGAAAVASGLVGALHDWGLPQDRLQGYEAALKAGGILLGVKPRTEADAQLIETQWNAIGAESRHVV
jgi:hypothetical protein